MNKKAFLFCIPLIYFVLFGCSLYNDKQDFDDNPEETQGTSTISINDQFGSSTCNNLNNSDSTVVEQDSEVAVYNLKEFSIEQNHIITFSQPDKASIAVINVLGNETSVIAGMLKANGIVFIINPNGIIFESGSKADAAGFLITTSNLSLEELQTGKLFVFNSGSLASIENHGTIDANHGAILLLAHCIINDGNLNSMKGIVGLAAGPELPLNQYFSESSYDLTLSKTAINQTDSYIENTGTITAIRIEINIGGEHTYLAFKNSGTISAGEILQNYDDFSPGEVIINTITGDIENTGAIVSQTGQKGGNITINGKNITLSESSVISANGSDAGGNGGQITIESLDTTMVSGILDASAPADNRRGGQIYLLGDKVGLINALVNASGGAGGGKVLIGGDYKGGNPDIQNADRTYVCKDSVIKTDALFAGDGGMVVVWADDFTAFYGSISATGGENRGNGGFAEVSGNISLSFNGNADMYAPSGNDGTLLLDPSTLTIINGAGPGSLDFSLPDILAGEADVGGNTVSENALEAIAGATNVILEATGQITINDIGTLSMAQGSGNFFRITSTTSAGITFVNPANTISTAGGDIILQAQGTGTISNICNLDSNNGTITINSSDAISINNGSSIDAGNGLIDLDAVNNITLGQLVTTGAVNVTLTTTSGAIIDGGDTGGNDINCPNAALIIDAVNGVGDGNAIEINVASVDIDNTAAGGIAINETNAVTLTNITANNGAISVNTGGNTTVTSVVSSTDADANDITITASAGDIEIGTVNAGTTNGDVTITATAGAITDTDADSLITADDLSLSARDEIGVVGGPRINTTADTITAGSTNAGNIALNETNAVTLTNVSTNNGAVEILTGGNTTVTSVVSSTDADANDITITASAGDIEIDTVNAGTTNGDVTITATAGAITDTDADSLITADDLSLSARDEIGVVGGPRINTTADTITAGSTNAGNIALNETNTVTLTNVSTNDGAVEVISGNTMTVTSVTSGDAVAGDSHNVTLSATSGNMLLSSVTADNTANLSADAGSITDNNGVANNISAVNADLSAQVNIGTITDFPTAAGDAIELTLTGSLTNAEVTQAGGAINLYFTGAVTVGGNVIVDSDGTASAIITATGDLTVSGGITLNNNDNLGLISGGTLTIPDSLSTGGDIRLSGTTDVVDSDRTLTLSSSDLYFNSGSSGGNTALTTTVATLTAHLITNSADLTINETNGIDLVDVDTFDGAISVNTGGATTVTSVVSSTDADANDITITASAGDIEIDTVNAGTTNGDVTITATAGAITDTDMNSAVTCDVLELIAGSNICASGAELNTSAVNLEAQAGGNIYIIETDTVTAGGGTLTGISTTAANGLINLSTTNGTITIDESISANGSGTVTLAAQGAGNDVDINAGVASGAGSISITAPDTIFLGANITTTDNSIALTGIVEVDNNVMIDSINTGSGGNITVNGTIDSAGSNNLTMQAGTGDINLINTIGGTNPLNNLTVNSADIVDLPEIHLNNDLDVTSTTRIDINGTITAAGLVDLTSALIDVNNSISSTGSTVDLTGAIQLGAGIITSGNDITLTGNVTRDNTDNVTITTGVSPATGNITITGAVNGEAAQNRNLILTAGAGNIEFRADNGTLQPLNEVTINTAASLTMLGTTTTAAGGFYIYDTDGLTLNRYGGAGAVTINANVSIYAPGATITSNFTLLTCQNFILYNGNLALNGNLTMNLDLVLVGAGYNIDDGVTGVAGVFAYNHPARAAATLANPNTTLLTIGSLFPGTGVNIAAYNGGVADLAGRTITVNGNFYVNGCDLDGNSGNWFLIIPDNDDATSAFAEAYNMTVDNSQASGGFVAASEATDGPPTLTNSNWDFTVPAFEPLGTYTVLDNVIRVEFDDFIENDNNEISAAITGNLISLDGDTINFTGTFTSPTCLPAETTNGAGDLQFFYIQVNTDTWNTDATGTSSGDVNSTDRSGLPQNIVPDIAIPKDTAGAFITLIDQHKNRIFHYMGGNIFTNVSDHCRPTLYQIDVDQAVHNMPVVDDYDAHNFFQLYYSEAVTIGDLVVSGPMERSETTFIDATEHGGALIESTPDVEVIGYFEYTGTFQYSSDEPIPDTANSLYQTTSHRLVIYISGYRDGLGDWPGYHWNVSNPLGGGVTIDVLSNSFITDNSANNNQIDDSYDPASFTNAGGWDIDPPAFSTYQPGPGYNPTNIYEIVTLDTNVNGTLDRLEFHLHDDSSNETGWLSTHPDPNSGGIRDCTILNLDMDAFFIEEVGVTPLTNAYNVSCNTDVNNLWFGIINVNEDQYFRLDLNEGGYSWGLLSRLYLTYDASIGHITDLAGNRLESATEIECIERIPPRIDFTLAVVGQQTVFVKFSEKVYGNDAAPRIPIDIYDFAIAGGTNTFTGITYLDLDSDNGVQEIFLTLQNPLTENEAVALFIQPQALSIYDYIGLDMSTVPHRITDIGLGVVVPVWADDGVHSDILHGDTGALRDFDGTGYLMDRDITLELSILSTNWQGASCRLYFDIDPDSSYLYNELWLPTLIPSFNDQANLEARSILPFRSDGAVRDFIIPSSDEEILNDAEVEFIIKLGDLFCARVTNPADPRTVVPWSFTIKDIILQKSNVTILNNVINPSQGEHTILHLILETAGIVTIQVFDLKGDIVDVLHRGRLTEGEHIFTWDGQNRGGRDVVRGIYFIKVIGPDINEIRKVLVVK